MDRMGGLLRSLLFVPGSDTRKLGKVARFGADAIVIDLEDAVADEEKVGARATTRAAIPELAGKATLVVRVNGIETGLLDDDVAAIAVEGVDLIMVPKVESADTLAHLDDRIARAERAAGIAPGTIRRPRAHRDRARDRRLRGDPRGRARTRPDRRLRRRRLLRAARHRPHARGHRDRLRALTPGRRRARGRPGGADRRPLAQARGRRGPRGGQPALPRARLPGPRDRLPAAGRDGAAGVLGALRRGGRASAPRRRGVRGGRGARRRLAARRRPLRRLPHLPPGQGPHRALRRLAHP